jgi:hypothetical protein
VKAVLAGVARDFLAAGPDGVQRLLPGSDKAIGVATEIVARLGTLASELDEVLRLCIVLERAQALETAEAIERALAAAPPVRTLLGVRGEGDLVPHLRRRRLRLLQKPRSSGQMLVREMLVKAPPHRAKRYLGRV